MSENTKVLIETSLGNITVELFENFVDKLLFLRAGFGACKESVDFKRARVLIEPVALHAFDGKRRFRFRRERRRQERRADGRQKNRANGKYSLDHFRPCKLTPGTNRSTSSRFSSPISNVSETDFFPTVRVSGVVSGFVKSVPTSE